MNLFDFETNSTSSDSAIEMNDVEISLNSNRNSWPKYTQPLPWTNRQQSTKVFLFLI